METLKQILIFIANYQKEIIYMIYFGMILVTLNTIYLLYKILIQKKHIDEIKEITLKEKKSQSLLNSCNKSLNLYKYLFLPILIPLLFFLTIIISGIVIKGKLVLSIKSTILTIIAIALIILISVISTNKKLKKENIF